MCKILLIPLLWDIFYPYIQKFFSSPKTQMATGRNGILHESCNMKYRIFSEKSVTNFKCLTLYIERVKSLGFKANEFLKEF